MKLQFYFEKLYASSVFKEFKKQNKSGFLCSGFFVIDKEKDDNKAHLDFYVPEDEKMFSFGLIGEVSKMPVEIFESEFKEIPDNVDFNFDEVENLILKEMEKQNVKNKIQKIILSLQSSEGKVFLLATVFISGLGILKVNIDIEKMEVTGFEKKSFFDMVNVFKKR